MKAPRRPLIPESEWPYLPSLVEQLNPLQLSGCAYNHLFGIRVRHRTSIPIPDRGRIILKIMKDEWWMWEEIRNKVKFSKGEMGKTMMFLNHNQYLESKTNSEYKPFRKMYHITERGSKWVNNF